MNFKMRNLLNRIQIVLLFVCFIGCKYVNGVDLTDTNKSEETQPLAQANQNDCFDILNELVRSSNFPFDSWGITSNDFDIYVDEETKDYIRIKLLDDREKQTIGWVKYYKERL